VRRAAGGARRRGEVVAEVGALLDRLEAADFGGGGGTPVPAAELRATIERLERELRRER
jgi:hypothetical protein